MGTVLEDVTSETLSAEDIMQRVVDWETRVTNFYTMIDGWLPDGWQACEGEPVFMHEELMRRFRIGRKEIPTRILTGRTGNSAWLKPRALWIIGVNGRIDLKRDGPEASIHHYLIVDMASNFKPPDWQVVPAKRRYDREPVTEDWLKRILK